MRKEEEERLRNVCAVVECASCKDTKVKCPACTDPAKEGMRARCLSGACTLVETKAR